jgi:hypothetical protein
MVRLVDPFGSGAVRAGAPSFRVLGERVGSMKLDFKMKNLDV